MSLWEEMESGRAGGHVAVEAETAGCVRLQAKGGLEPLKLKGREGLPPGIYGHRPAHTLTWTSGRRTRVICCLDHLACGALSQQSREANTYPSLPSHGLHAREVVTSTAHPTKEGWAEGHKRWPGTWELGAAQTLTPLVPVPRSAW